MKLGVRVGVRVGVKVEGEEIVDKMEMWKLRRITNIEEAAEILLKW